MSELEREPAVQGGQLAGADVDAASSGAGAASEPGASRHDSGEGTPEPEAPAVAESPGRAALAELAELAEKPVAEHPGVYQRVHSQLQGALNDIDDA